MPRQHSRKLGCGCRGLPAHSRGLEGCYPPGRASASLSAKGASTHLPVWRVQGKVQGSAAPCQEMMVLDGGENVSSFCP